MTRPQTQPLLAGIHGQSMVNQHLENSTISDGAPKVINLSDYDPSPDEISLLKRGLKFCPTPEKPDLLNLEVDIAELLRKVELVNYFSTFKDTSDKEEVLLKKTSNFQPLPSRDPYLSSICSQIRDFATTLHTLPTKWKNNITPGERQALHNLENNKTIRITRVDKGGSVVILNRDDYIHKVNASLNNHDIYKKLPQNTDKKVITRINTFTAKYRSCFDKMGKEKKYIADFDFTTANLYGLPKIHKSKVIKSELINSNNGYLKITKEVDLAFRLINGGTNSPTAKLSEVVDILLKPFCPKVPSYIKDYVDFLNKLPQVPVDSLNDIKFKTCDVVNMYGNITVELGIKAIWYWMSKFPELLNSRFPPEFVVEALEIIMKNSNFSFNGNFFTLVKGTATGTVTAPAYAILTMGYLEVLLYKQVKQKFGDIIHNYFVLHWKRYLDDCFIMWKESFGDFNEILILLNNLDPNINFTIDQSDTKVSFLNLLIYKDSNRILTDIYYKDTDTHDYLPFKSCHPRHVTTNIPGNLARMICTIVDDPVRRANRLQELFTWLSNSEYPHNVINEKFNYILSLDRDSLRQKTVKEEKKSITFVQTHNPKNPHVFWYLKQQFLSLTSSRKFGEIFKGYDFIKSERQPKNLGRILQKSNLKPVILPPGSVKCGVKKCGTCPYLLETNNVNFNTDAGAYTFKLFRHFSCYSTDIIYKITCKGCGLYYIGQTCYLRQRVTKHKSDIRNDAYRFQKVHTHIFKCAKEHVFPFTIVPFYHVKQGTVTARLTVEEYFRRKFNPQLNAVVN